MAEVADGLGVHPPEGKLVLREVLTNAPFLARTTTGRLTSRASTDNVGAVPAGSGLAAAAACCAPAELKSRKACIAAKENDVHERTNYVP
jgi:hypothetical protein